LVGEEGKFRTAEYGAAFGANGGRIQAAKVVATNQTECVVRETTGGIKRRMRLFRLPDANPATRLRLTRRIRLEETGDNALYVCVTQEDGHLIWSSPIYLFR
jgi:hypothetical protein